MCTTLIIHHIYLLFVFISLNLWQFYGGQEAQYEK